MGRRDELSYGDGVDPRKERKQRHACSPHKQDYSALRLASQIRDTLNLVIPQSGHRLLDSFVVGAVEPYGIGVNFAVQVYSTDPNADYDPHEVKAVLTAMKPHLRAEVARDVTRKKAPDFKFDVLPPRVMPR